MKPNKQTTIQTLLALGRGQREVARSTGIDRKTIRRYAGPASTANSPGVATGSPAQNPPPRSRKSWTLRGWALRVPAGQAEKGHGSGPESGRCRASWRVRTRSTARRNPAWRGDRRRKKGPEIIRALVDGGGTRNRTRVRNPSQIVTPRPLGRGFDDLATSRLAANAWLILTPLPLRHLNCEHVLDWSASRFHGRICKT